MQPDKQVKAVLKHLIEVCKEESRRFKLASERSANPELKRVFRLFAQLRKEFAEELEQYVSNLYTPTVEEPTLPIVEGLVVQEFEEKERSVLKIYETALRLELPSNLRSMIFSQSNLVKQACDYMRSFNQQ
jgi:hypothetical protein